MKRFHFPFERVMEWRDRCADAERVKLQRLHEVRSELDDARSRLDATISASRVRPHAGNQTNGSDLQQIAHYVQALRVQELAVHAKQQECQTDIARQTAACISANRDHKLLVRLRERRLASWQIGLDRETEHDAAESWLCGRSRSGALSRRHP